MSGSPTETENDWKSPTAMPFVPGFAVHVTVPTAWLTEPLSVLIAVVDVRPTAAVQPGTGWTKASAIGWSVGNCTCTFTVVAASISFGTTNEDRVGALRRLAGADLHVRPRRRRHEHPQSPPGSYRSSNDALRPPFAWSDPTNCSPHNSARLLLVRSHQLIGTANTPPVRRDGQQP